MLKPMPMTEAERTVWGLIEGRDEGPAGDFFGPIKAPEIARATGLPEREVREIIRCLRRSHGKLIGSRTVRPAGYYECKTGHQVDDFCGSLWGRAIDMLVTMRDMKRWSSAEVARQVELALESASGGQEEEAA